MMQAQRGTPQGQRSATPYLLAMRDILDEQLETADGQYIGRVADAVLEMSADPSYVGSAQPVLTYLIAGPQALAGRIWEPLRIVARHIFQNRFERWLPLAEVRSYGPTVRLRGVASEYALGQSDRWLARHVLRWLPGSGYVATAGEDAGQPQRDQQPVAHVIDAMDRGGGQPEGEIPTCFYMEDLIGSVILTADGRRVGKVIDVRMRNHHQPRIEALAHGATGWLYRLHVLRPLASLTGAHMGLSLIPWEQVATFQRNRVVLRADDNAPRIDS